MNTQNRLDRVQMLLTAAIIAFSLGVVIVSAEERHEYNARMDKAKVEIALADADRDNAIKRAEVYRMKYQEALTEIADLQEQLERYSVILDEPPEGFYADLGWNYDYVVRVVGAEARGEPFEGMLAVAQCIAETAEKTGMTPEQVVKIPNRYAAPIGRRVMDGMESVNEACLRVFINGERPFAEPIEYFYSTEIYSEWHEDNLVFCFEIGGHRFFKAAE